MYSNIMRKVKRNYRKIFASRRTAPLNEGLIIVEPIADETADIEVKKVRRLSSRKYHVSQNKDKDADNYMKWRVRKDRSPKTIQYFDTQKQAIDFAQVLASKAKSTVVIHKLDGSIRKQDYTKKV